MAEEDEEWEYDSADEYDDGAPRAAGLRALRAQASRAALRPCAPVCAQANEPHLRGRRDDAGHDLREALPEREAAGGKDTGAAGPVVRSMSWDGTALKHTVWPVHPSGWKRPADYPIKGE